MSVQHPSIVEPHFSDLIDLRNPQMIYDEIKTIVRMTDPVLDFSPLSTALNTVLQIFRGEYPGYRACTTCYHDLQHTLDTLLAMTRLIHGASVGSVTFTSRQILQGLIAALFHDIGYIQHTEDRSGTGAKYTLTHIERGIGFLRNYLPQHGFDDQDVTACRCMLLCTGFNIRLHQIEFPDEKILLLGKMLGSADLLGQMADRAYLEKLLLLYYEFREGAVGEYTSELDLLHKTLAFYETTEKRLIEELGNVRHYMAAHFTCRWEIKKDLYQNAIKKNRDYLEFVLKKHGTEHRSWLRRENIIKRLEDEGR